MTRIRAALLALALLTAPTARAAEFDHYLLSLSIAPSFCALSPANQAKPDCQSLTAERYRATPLTVHGLWPNIARVSVNRQPSRCDGPSLGRLPAALIADLDVVMPGGAGLRRHEWRTHGTCSGLSPRDYFATLARLAHQANATIAPILAERGYFGRQMPTTDFLAALTASNPTLAAAVIVDCRSPRGGGQVLVEEIRITLSKDFVPIPADTVGMGQNSGCPRQGGLLPAGP